MDYPVELLTVLFWLFLLLRRAAAACLGGCRPGALFGGSVGGRVLSFCVGWRGEALSKRLVVLTVHAVRYSLCNLQKKPDRRILVHYDASRIIAGRDQFSSPR